MQAKLICFWVLYHLLIDETKSATTDEKPPFVKLPHTNYTAVIGKQVTIGCEISPDTTSVLWRFTNKNGYVTTIVISKPHWKYSGGTVENPSLTIKTVAPSDIGTYRCMARNTAGTTISNTSATLNVLEDFDECLSSPCQNHGTCIEGINTFTCRCTDQFEGDNCEIRKTISHCASTPCHNGGTCIESVGTYTCQCTEQYEGVNCEIRQLILPEPKSWQLTRRDCYITFGKDESEKLKTLSQLLYITLQFRNNTAQNHRMQYSEIYQPLRWIRTLGPPETRLLQLNPQFEIFSWNFLSTQTAQMQIRLEDTPIGCWQELISDEYEIEVRQLLLKHLKGDQVEICNEHVQNENGYAVFYYECCYVNKVNRLACYRLEKTVWMKIIDICTYVVIILVVLFFPMLIPSTFYKQKYFPSVYELKLEHPLYMTVEKTRGYWRTYVTLSAMQVKNDEPFPVETFETMEKFQDYLKYLEEEKVVKFRTENLELMVHHDQILSENHVSTSILGMLKNIFIKCEIRKNGEVAECCNANIYGCLQPCGKEYPWYKCLRSSMRFLLFLLVSLPWIIRVWVHYCYETNTRDGKEKAAEMRNLIFSFHANNLTSILTPIHALFIFCYIIIILDYLILGNVSGKINMFLRETLTNSLRFKQDSSRKKELNWCFRVLTFPLKKFGIFGLFVGLLWIPTWPLIIIVLSPGFFPMVGVIVCFSRCLFRNFLPRNRQERLVDEHVEPEKKKDVVIKLVAVFVILIGAVSVVLLTVECVVFMINVAVHLLIGLILNSSRAMQYITIILLAYFYFYKCFDHINDLYSKFNKAIQKILEIENKAKIDKVASTNENIKTNTAFKVKYASKDTAYLSNDNGAPKWCTKGVVLFKDKFDVTYISKEFLFKACEIDHPYCPGKLSSQILRACRRFITVLLFLLFIILVVLAFGDEYNISISNQLLVMIASGSVPWLLMKCEILFSVPDQPDLDELKNNSTFISSFRELIEHNEEFLKVYDINVLDHPYLNGTNEHTFIKTTKPGDENTILKTITDN